ncbi:MAG: hypothetical protein ACRDAM_12420 [Casimicrobium sp.]
MKRKRTLHGLRTVALTSGALACSFALGQTSSSRLSNTAIDELNRGFIAAQACEKEIDDDLSAYRSCIDHLADRRGRAAKEKLGIHFQAWIVADLMARQHSDFAATMRSEQQKKTTVLLRTTRINLTQLCEAKRVACTDIAARMKAASR